MKSKRIFDIIASSIGLLVLSPLFIVIALIIKLTSHGGVFFRQKRVGYNGKSFYIHKFRTMVFNAQELGLKITVGNDKRITAIGKLLRKTKIDELPQLIDVLIGDMSLVGPRPEIPEYVELYPDAIKDIVLSVRPGVTDWASIKMIDENELLAKSDVPHETYVNVIMPEKLAFAVDYVKNRSFLMDIKIIFATLVKIVCR